jgi:hypothetical protein
MAFLFEAGFLAMAPITITTLAFLRKREVFALPMPRFLGFALFDRGPAVVLPFLLLLLCVLLPMRTLRLALTVPMVRTDRSLRVLVSVALRAMAALRATAALLPSLALQTALRLIATVASSLLRCVAFRAGGNSKHATSFFRGAFSVGCLITGILV